jgi:hypothetical protein
LPQTHVAVRALLSDLRAFHSLDLKPAAGAANSVTLAVTPGTVTSGQGSEIDSQAYCLVIAPAKIEIAANTDQGLFYGVQTLLQLFKPGPGGRLRLPQASIDDWPAFQLRFLHWDTKHHQDRPETLRRFLDWSARFKVNMIGFELEDKFEYPSHPAIGAPGAFTTAELQELVDYGLERFIQIVPQIQSPAHMAYVLKHPQFADLRADGNNYQSCLCDEGTYKLLFSMYEDVIRATRGVNYFHVSTDEVYYAGICAKCTRPFNDENRSLSWVEFANRAHAFLKGQNRRMLAWVEYPVLPKHIPLLPPDLINAVLQNDPDQIRAEREKGIRQLIYVSLQGDELLFPDHLAQPSGPHPNRGRIEGAYRTIVDLSSRGDPLGVYGAAWDDSGLHNETFWLGWSAVAHYGWNFRGSPSDQHVSEFMRAYYGPEAVGMEAAYRALQSQARWYERSWDQVVSRVRGPAYGNSEGKGVGGTRYDLTLPSPALPALPDLGFVPVYTGKYAVRADEADRMTPENVSLQERLRENMLRVSRNRYNLEVLHSLAEFVSHHQRLLAGMRQIESTLAEARKLHQEGNRPSAVNRLASTCMLAASLIAERSTMFGSLKRVWEKSRFEKGRTVDGRKFLHVMDDTKDHVADRRPDLSYLTAPEESIGLEKWLADMMQVVRRYAADHKLPAPQLPDRGSR